MLKQIAIVPNGKRYWILPDKVEEKSVTVQGYKLEENGGKKDPPLQGRVVAIGDGDGEKMKYRAGDLVIYGAYAGNEHTHDGEKYTILHQDEILGHLIETPFDERDTTDLTQ